MLREETGGWPPPPWRGMGRLRGTCLDAESRLRTALHSALERTEEIVIEVESFGDGWIVTQNWVLVKKKVCSKPPK